MKEISPISDSDELLNQARENTPHLTPVDEPVSQNAQSSQTIPQSSSYESELDHMENGTNVNSSNRSSKWQLFFVILSILQIVCFVLPYLVLVVSMLLFGVGYIYLIMALVPMYILISTPIALISLFALPFFMRRNELTGRMRVLIITSLVFSILTILQTISFVASSLSFDASLNHVKQQINKDSDEFERGVVEISNSEAEELLLSCKLRGFFYTNQTNKNDGEWGELSDSGVVLTRVEGKPYRISIADKLIPELVPIAREAQKKCGGWPQFFHDGINEPVPTGKLPTE